MSRTHHHGLRGREKKFGKQYRTWIWRSAIDEEPSARMMKWPGQVDLITAGILGDTLIATPPKRKKCTWHFDWMRGSRGRRHRSLSFHHHIYFWRPERALVRALIRKLFLLDNLDGGPVFPDAKHRPHRYYW